VPIHYEQSWGRAGLGVVLVAIFLKVISKLIEIRKRFGSMGRWVIYLQNRGNLRKQGMLVPVAQSKVNPADATKSNAADQKAKAKRTKLTIELTDGTRKSDYIPASAFASLTSLHEAVDAACDGFDDDLIGEMVMVFVNPKGERCVVKKGISMSTIRAATELRLVQQNGNDEVGERNGHDDGRLLHAPPELDSEDEERSQLTALQESDEDDTGKGPIRSRSPSPAPPPRRARSDVGARRSRPALDDDDDDDPSVASCACLCGPSGRQYSSEASAVHAMCQRIGLCGDTSKSRCDGADSLD